MRLKAFTVALLILACWLVGCNTLFKGTPETILGHTNVVVSVQPDGSLVTNVISQPTIVVTNWVKGPAFDTIESVGGVVPVYGEVAVAIIGFASTVYLGWLNRRNKKVAVSTIQGVDQFRTALQSSGDRGVALDDKLTAMLKNAHLESGVKETVDEMIKVHTGKKEKPEAVEEVKKLL